jgi:hypothetical protein
MKITKIRMGYFIEPETKEQDDKFLRFLKKQKTWTATATLGSKPAKR